MERPRVFHLAKLGSSRLLYPHSSPCSPSSPCTPASVSHGAGAFAVSMAPLASSEPDIPGMGAKPNPAPGPAVTHSATFSVASSVTLSAMSTVSQSIVTTSPPGPSPSPSSVSLLRKPSKRNEASSSSFSYSEVKHAESNAPIVNGACTLPRYAGGDKDRKIARYHAPHQHQHQQQQFQRQSQQQSQPQMLCHPRPQPQAQHKQQPLQQMQYHRQQFPQRQQQYQHRQQQQQPTSVARSPHYNHAQYSTPTSATLPGRGAGTPRFATPTPGTESQIPTSPSKAVSNVPSRQTDSNRQRKSVREKESGLPRPAANKLTSVNQKSLVSPEENIQGQSSPQQIRKVLRSSPAYSQFQARNVQAAKADSRLPREDVQRPSCYGSIPSPKSAQQISEPYTSIGNSHYIHTRSETSLLDGTTIHTSTSVSITHSVSSNAVYNDHGYYHQTKPAVASKSQPKLENSQRVTSTALPRRSDRPANLAFIGRAATHNGHIMSPVSQQSPGSRISQVPSSRPLEIQSANKLHNSKPRAGQIKTPSKSNPSTPQRQPDSRRRVSQVQSSARSGSQQSFGKSPTKRSPVKVKDSNDVKGNVPNGNIVPFTSGQPTQTHKRPDQRHKTGFGFGYTCTANATFKGKPAVKHPGNTERARAVPSRVESSKNNETGNGTDNRSINDSMLNEQDVSTSDEAFQRGRNRNSMRLATQGYSSMSDLTKSIDCLVLEPEPKSCPPNDKDSNVTHFIFPNGVQFDDEFRYNDDESELTLYQSRDLLRHPAPRKFDKCTNTSAPHIASNTSAPHRASTSMPSPSQDQGNCVDADGSRLSAGPKSLSGMTSREIPIKQSYFADGSFILIPGENEATKINSCTSSSGSPSSGYSSSPALARERRTGSATSHNDGYYRQQEHHNKIKRRSYVLATSSISDLSCCLDEIDIGEGPVTLHSRDLSPSSDGESTPMSSFCSVKSEEFHTPQSQRRQASDPVSENGPANSSFGSYYSCQSSPSWSPYLNMPPTKGTTGRDNVKRESFYDNYQETSPRLARHKDVYESSESGTESEYKTASSSSGYTRKGLTASLARPGENPRAGFLSRHWVRTTPYSHTRTTPTSQTLDYRLLSQPSNPYQYSHYSGSSRSRPQVSPKQEVHNSKDSPKASKKKSPSPSPSEVRRVPKKRVTSPIAWCTSRAAAEGSRQSQAFDDAEPRRRSNSSPFPSAKLSPRQSREIPESATAPSLGRDRCSPDTHHSLDYSSNNRPPSPNVVYYSLDNSSSHRPPSPTDSVDSEPSEYLDANWLPSRPRGPPALGRPRRKEYAGFDSQPLPMDSFVSDSSSVYTDNTSVCSSRAPSRSANVENLSRRSSIASSTPDLTISGKTISGGFNSAAAGSITPKRQMSEDTICNDDDLSYQDNLCEQLPDDEYVQEPVPQIASSSTHSLPPPPCSSSCFDAVDDKPYIQNMNSCTRSASVGGPRYGVAATTDRDRNFLRGTVSSQSQRQPAQQSQDLGTLTRTQSCLPERRTSDASNSTCSRKSSTSGVSSGSNSSGRQREPWLAYQQPQQQQQHQQQNNLYCQGYYQNQQQLHQHRHHPQYQQQQLQCQQQQQQYEQKMQPLKDSPPSTKTKKSDFPPKRKYFSSRDILDLLITPEGVSGKGGASSLTSLEKQAQKVCRAILCCSSELSRRVPQREFDL